MYELLRKIVCVKSFIKVSTLKKRTKHCTFICFVQVLYMLMSVHLSSNKIISEKNLLSQFPESMSRAYPLQHSHPSTLKRRRNNDS